ncbi:MAG: hypothetical protein JW976_01325 [Syntrophaceae bacterium]|nr:hypothetical protein [Syntrophaceae bacterium]
MARFFYPFNVVVVLLVCVTILFSFSKSYAPTKMSDAELSDIEGQAIFSINYYSASSAVPFGSDFSGTAYNFWTGSQSVVRLMLGIDAELNGHFQSFKMGYYNGGWDQDTTNYFWGTTNRATPLKWTGVFVDFGFDNYSNSGTRQLNYIELGTISASGHIEGTICTINGLVYGGTGTNEGVMLRQTAAGFRSINFNNEVMSFVFAAKYRYQTPSGGGGVGGTNNLQGIFIKIPYYNADS